MAGEYIRVVGLKELLNAFGRIDKSLRKQLTDELRVLARLVKARARDEAVKEGFTAPGESGRGRGELLKHIGISVRAGVAYITEGAVDKRGFRYPAVFEFGKREPWMHRPFLLPAVEASRGEIEAGLEGMLDRLIVGEGF